MTGVLAAAGYFFHQLSERHFNELDQHTLHEKLRAGEALLGELQAGDDFERLRPRLQALLGGHSEIRGSSSMQRGASGFPSRCQGGPTRACLRWPLSAMASCRWMGASGARRWGRCRSVSRR